jgi:hypothetical protein
MIPIYTVIFNPNVDVGLLLFANAGGTALNPWLASLRPLSPNRDFLRPIVAVAKVSTLDATSSPRVAGVLQFLPYVYSL